MILRTNARTIPIPTIIIVSFVVVRLTTTIAQINTINFNRNRLAKYIHPYANVTLNNTAIIPAEIIRDILPQPLEYQQIKANKGDKIVNPIHIITYLLGKKPAISFEYI